MKTLLKDTKVCKYNFSTPVIEKPSKELDLKHEHPFSRPYTLPTKKEERQPLWSPYWINDNGNRRKGHKAPQPNQKIRGRTIFGGRQMIQIRNHRAKETIPNPLSSQKCVSLPSSTMQLSKWENEGSSITISFQEF